MLLPSQSGDRSLIQALDDGRVETECSCGVTETITEPTYIRGTPCYHRERWLGKVFGDRTVIAVVGLSKGRYRVRCVCGYEGPMGLQSLYNCSPCHHPQVGDVYGSRTVIGYKGSKVKTRCLCGVEQLSFPTATTLEGLPTCRCQATARPRRTPHEQSQMKLRARQRRQEDLSQYMMELIRKRADVRQKRVPCTLTAADIYVPDRCLITGKCLVPGLKDRAVSPTVVLLDEERGYIPGNIQVISWEAAEQRRHQRRREATAAAKEHEQQQARAFREQRKEEVRQERKQRKEEVRQERAEHEAAEQAQQAERTFEVVSHLRQMQDQPPYNVPVTRLPTTARVDEAFQRLGVKTVWDLLFLGPGNFAGRRNFGRYSIKTIQKALALLGVLWPLPEHVRKSLKAD